MPKKLSVKNVLLFHKTSIYQHCLNQKRSLDCIAINSKHFARFKETHEQHYKTLHTIESTLQQENIKYKKAKRGQKIDFSKYHFIITVGGDGTLLEAARQLRGQVVFPINSDLKWSVGHLCSANDKNVQKAFKCLFANKFRLEDLNRLTVKINKKNIKVDILNDLLICHKNPAAISRYMLSIGGKKEEQKSSGIWIATAAGSTGAIHSAGGKKLPILSSKYQYVPRELYSGHSQKYKLKGGVLGAQDPIKMTSMMKEGMIYLDGCHEYIKFSMGDEVIISSSKNPLKVIRI